LRETLACGGVRLLLQQLRLEQRRELPVGLELRGRADLLQRDLVLPCAGRARRDRKGLRQADTAGQALHR
jgi:hypothetical protein